MAEASVPHLTGDFIKFDWDDSSDEEVSAPASSHAVGQPQLFTRGNKRTADEMEAESRSGYSKKQRIAAESRVTPWAAAVDWDNCRTAADMLNQEVNAFVDYISPTPEEHDTRTMIVHWIQNTVVAEFPDAEVVPFGSFATKLYLPTGDIDLVVSSPSIRTGDVKSTLYRLAYILRRSNIADHVEVLAKTKVPIVKFVTSHGRISVDISVNQLNGIRAAGIIKGFVEELPAVKPLVLIVKSFLNQRNMNEVFTGGLGSYSIVCMVTNFLQMHPKIRRCAIDPMENLGVLLVEFFETYGRFFQYDQVGISLRNGGHYLNKRSQGWSNPSSPFLLTIEDPQDPLNDVSGGSFGFMRVKHTLQGAFEVLGAALCLRGSAMLQRRHDPHDGRSSDEMSLLGSIMGVTPETISKRRLVTELYTNGVLHRLLNLPPPVLGERAAESQNASKQYRSRDTSPQRRGHHARFASRSRSRSPPGPRSKHRHRRSFSPPRKREKQPARVSDYISDGSSGYAEQGERRRKRRKGQVAPQSDTIVILDDDSDDMWAEASCGAQEILHRNHEKSLSSVSEGGKAPRNVGRDDRSDSEEGRYAIADSRTKHQQNGESSKWSNHVESKEVIYISDDSDGADHGKTRATAAAQHLPGDGSKKSATTAKTGPPPDRLRNGQGGVGPSRTINTSHGATGSALPPLPLPPRPARQLRSPPGHSVGLIATPMSSNPPPTTSKTTPIARRSSRADQRRAFWSAKSGLGSEREDDTESSWSRRK